MKYIIPGDPVPLARARVNTNSARIWDSQKQIKLLTGLEIRKQHDNRPLFKDPVELNISFFMKQPKRGPNSKLYYHQSIPDLDNMIKYICDVCNGILYKDDAIISSIRAKKVYDKNPRTELTISTLHSNEDNRRESSE